MSLEFLNTKFEKAAYFANLLSSYATGGKADELSYMRLRSELLSDPEISHLVPAFVRTNRDLKSFWAFIKTKHETYADRRNYLSEQFTPLLDFLEFGTLQTLTSAGAAGFAASNISSGLTGTAALGGPLGAAVGKLFTPTPSNSAKAAPLFTQSAPAQAPARNKRKVFIVHGRDNAAKQEVARFVEALGLIPIILHEQASGGLTIIEKIERYSNDADFALVLYTPCDLGHGIHETDLPTKNRARQNVVFEHGYLMAKLGRENVCALVKGSVETPNDVSGVVYVDLDASGAWKNEIAKELKACGYELKPWY